MVLPLESGGEFMCDVCVEIDAIMARYKRLRDQISDEQTRDAAELAEGCGLRAARLHAIKQDIAKHLSQPGLSITALALRHGCTPRFIQRLFEREGTSFTDYVLTQRLACAHRLLTDLRHAGEKISTIAFDAGFGDVSYFNRAFRQRYGDTPSAIRMLARTGRS